MFQTSVKMKLLCTQVAKDILGQGIDVSGYVRCIVTHDCMVWRCQCLQTELDDML